MENNLVANILVTFIHNRVRSDLSDSESSSDEEFEYAIEHVKKSRIVSPRVVGYMEVIQGYADHEFKSHFRMSRTTFQYLLEMISEDLRRKVKGCPAIPCDTQLLIAIWKMATMDSYRSVCDRFNVGRATAVRAVRRVTHALFRRAERFIQWPSEEQAAHIMRGFEEISGFPKVIGAIDGTHIKIDAPKQNAADYVNRKVYHSIQLQIVCDHTTRITHCYTGYPGSVHDQSVFRQSEVANFLNDNLKFPEESHLLGDAAYELHHHLLTPFRDNGHLTRRQINFNYRHSSARVAVERCIGLLKGRMRSLLQCLPMTRIDLMPEYIVACCVIHNICLLREDYLNVVTIPRPQEQNVINEGRNRDNVGIHKRNMIMENLPL